MVRTCIRRIHPYYDFNTNQLFVKRKTIGATVPESSSLLAADTGAASFMVTKINDSEVLRTQQEEAKGTADYNDDDDDVEDHSKKDF